MSDIDKVDKLANISGNQTQILGAPEFLVFCVDLIDAIICCEAYGGISPKKGLYRTIYDSDGGCGVLCLECRNCCELLSFGNLLHWYS